MLSEHDLQVMQDLLLTLLKALINHPDDLQVTADVKDTLVRFSVKAHPEDIGKIIGRAGKRANAIRTIMRAKATQVSCRILVDIDEEK